MFFKILTTSNSLPLQLDFAHLSFHSGIYYYNLSCAVGFRQATLGCRESTVSLPYKQRAFIIYDNDVTLSLT